MDEELYNELSAIADRLFGIININNELLNIDNELTQAWYALFCYLEKNKSARPIINKQKG